MEMSAPSVYRSAQSVVSFDEARRLAERHGTPLLAISRANVVQSYRTLQANLPGVEFFYAAKANPDPSILTTLRKLGCSVDVCSQGEARQALKARFRPESMIHTHPCKTVDNLAECYRLGIRWFTYDSAYELPKIARHAPGAKLLLRLAVSSSSSVIDLSAKFGASRHDALSLLLRANHMGLDVRGMSFHVGSQCLSPDDFTSALGEARRIWDQASDAGLTLDVLDIGGGIPAPYRQAILSMETYCQALSSALESTFGDLPIRIIAEPGRCLCAEAVTLIVSVIGKTVRGGRTWYIIDDGLYGSFSGKVYDHADFPLIAEGGEDRELFPCVVAGPTCDSTDVVARDQLLPNLEIGELLLIPTMGAYTSASASGFNGLALPRSVAID
jgi:ornithine decarboxylase